jgi:hypothetical protein
VLLELAQAPSQCMQIRQQILDLLLVERLSEAGHFAAAEADDFADAGRPLSERYSFLKIPFRPGPFLPRVE